MTIIDKLTEIKKAKEDLEKQLLEQSKAAFHETVKEIFDAHPKLESFSWRQYTPYFNDGEECVFSANADDLDYRYDGHGYQVVSQFSSGHREALRVLGDLREAHGKIQKLFGVLGSDALKELFGDHASVVVRRDAVDVEEYEHD